MKLQLCLPLAIVLAVVMATANAMSAEFNLFKAQVQKTQMQAVNALDQHRVVLMSNSSSAGNELDAACKMFAQLDTQSKCVASMEENGLPTDSAAEMCRCLFIPMVSQIKPLLDLQCGQSECADVLKALADDSGEPDFNKVCNKQDCFRQLVNTMRDMSKPPSPPSGCPAIPAGDSKSGDDDDDEMEKGIAAMSDGMNFFCAKNVKGEFCGQTFEAIGKTIDEDCGTKLNVSSCVCPAMASGGCCSKTAYNYFQLHDEKSATEFKEGFTTCGYNIEAMSACANGKQRIRKIVKQQLAFKGIACGKKKDEVAFIVQKLVADKAKVNIGNVGVIVDSCPCCKTTASRRLLETGSLTTTVSITGDDVDTAATNLNKAVDDGSMTDAELGGSVDKTTTTQAKVDTQQSDLPTATENPAGRFAPSLLVAVVIALVAALF